MLDQLRYKDGSLPFYTWPGLYPFYYVAQDGGILCADCANDYTEGRDNEEQLKPVKAEVNWEEQMFCENCYKQIESAC
jgi:hypothetical protein